MQKKTVDVILGLQWGDEGKGKIVDVFTPRYDIIARFQGGPNAGHTIIIGGKKNILHTIPSGIFHRETLNLIGNGVIIDPVILFREIDRLKEVGVDAAHNLLIARRAHLILPTHRLLDAALESAMGKNKIGSTLKGIGPAYTDKYARFGLRVGMLEKEDFHERYETLRGQHLLKIQQTGVNIQDHLLDGISFDAYEEQWLKAAERLRGLKMVDGELFINQALDEGKSVLAEGAQGAMLDVDFGSYPYVTSSNTITAGVCSGLGISPHRIGNVYGIFKAYCTRVGGGPFPTELFDSDGEKLRTGGMEFGSTTGRPRRCGWLDLPALKYAIMLNGVTSLIMMKADVLNDFPVVKVCSEYIEEGVILPSFPFDLGDSGAEPAYCDCQGWNTTLEHCRTYSDLPAELQQYVGYIEQQTGIQVSILSVGPDRIQTIFKEAL